MKHRVSIEVPHQVLMTKVKSNRIPSQFSRHASIAGNRLHLKIMVILS